MLDGVGTGEGSPHSVNPAEDTSERIAAPAGAAGATGEAESAPAEEEENADPQKPIIDLDEFLAIDDEKQQRELFLNLSNPEQTALLAKMDPQKRRKFLDNFSKEQANAFMEKDIEERLKQATEDDDKDLGERTELMDPDMEIEDKELEHNLDKAVEEGRTPDGGLTNIDSIKPLLEGMSKDDAKMLLKGKGIIKEETLTAATEGLPDTVEPEPEDSSKNTEMQATGNVLQEELDHRAKFLKTEGEKEGLTREEKEQVVKYQMKVGGLMTKLKDYFAEGEPGRKYARKGGKILYFALLTAVVILLLEMNLIYKASKRK